MFRAVSTWLVVCEKTSRRRWRAVSSSLGSMGSSVGWLGDSCGMRQLAPAGPIRESAETALYARRQDPCRGGARGGGHGHRVGTGQHLLEGDCVRGPCITDVIGTFR